MKDYKISVLADIYGALLTDRQLQLLRDYYDRDMSLSELSEKYGIARQSAKDAIDAAEKSLKEFDGKLNLSKRFNSIIEAADIIIESDNGSFKTLAKKIKSNL